jgi:hypothetical protein
MEAHQNTPEANEGSCLMMFQTPNSRHYRISTKKGIELYEKI